MRRLAGKVAVVTGAGSGIGRALARALGTEGARIVVADLDGAAAGRTVEELTGRGVTATAHQVDVTDEPGMRALVDAVLERHGVVDVVVNNAGITTAPVPATDTPLAVYRTVMDVNFWGVVHGSLLFLPHLLTRPEASLVNVSSFAGLVGISRMSPYSASKFGVRGFTESLRMEYAGGPLTVSLACPGGTKTRLVAHSPVVDPDRRDAMQRNLDHSGQARSPEYVARAIVRGIRRGSPRMLIGPDTVVLDRLVRAMPGRYSALLRRGTERMFDKALG